MWRALGLAALVIAAGAGARRAEARSAATAPSTAAPGPKAAAPDDADANLAFVRDGAPVRTLTRAELTAKIPVEKFTAFDPYYERKKTFRALPLAAVVKLGFGASADELKKLDFVLRARDGYTVPMPGSKLFEKGGYLAIADVDFPQWEPIGPQHANPGPFYVVWREPNQTSRDTYPRPWELAGIEIARYETTFPHTVPTGLAAGAPAMHGFGIFREQCIACHAINQEGGHVGPDLNIPQSVVEYRPAAQIRAYIRDPHTFRYSNMPAHPGLSEADLDALLAYFDAMKSRKHDPDAQPSSR